MLTRRQMIAGMMAVPAAGLVTACSGGGGGSTSSPAAGGDITLRMSWWGNADRAERTQKAVDAYLAQADKVSVQTEFLDWTQYWDKLSTLTASGNPPDVMQMSEAYQALYATNGTLLDLRPLIDDKTITLPGLDPTALPAEGGIHAVPWSVNMRSVHYSPSQFAEAGLTFPDDIADMSWEDFAGFLDASKSTAGRPISVDPGFWIENFEVWLMQHDKSLYSASGTAGFEQADLEEFWTMTQDWVSRGLVTDAQTTSPMANGGTDQAALVTRNALIDYRWSSEAVIFESLGVPDIEIASPPNETGHPGRFWHAAMLLSVSAKSAQPAESAKLLEYLITNPDAAVEIGMERGAPASSNAADAISGDLSAIERRLIAYHDSAQAELHATPITVPPGGGEMLPTYIRMYEEVAFGQASISENAAKFTEQMTKIASQA